MSEFESFYQGLLGQIYCPGCALAIFGEEELPPPHWEELDYPATCDECGAVIGNPLSEEGLLWLRENWEILSEEIKEEYKDEYKKEQ